MKTLALEFSSAERTAALLDKDSNGAPTCLAQTSETGLTTANAFSMIDQALEDAGWRREEIRQIAVGLGPGSYTGIRAAIAIAQGWSLAGEVKLQGVNSAEALVECARSEGLRGPVAIAIDAQRGEFHAVKLSLDAAPESIAAPALELVDAKQLADWAAAGHQVLGPGINKKVSAAMDLSPDARQVGLLALRRESGVKGEELEPIYLRETSFVRAPAPRTIPEIGDRRD